MNIEFLELSLLLILFLNVLRNYLVINQQLLILFVGLFFIFSTLTFLKYLKIFVFEKSRFAILVLMILVLFISIFNKVQNSEVKHDGAILTDAATEMVIAGRNPYSADFKWAFEKVNFKPADFVYSSYMYSPLTFLINIPNKLISNLIGVFRVDFRFTLIFIFLATGIVASRFVEQKILFLIIFMLNPIFLPLTFYGANEAIMLFFLAMILVFLIRKKYIVASISLALATSAKLLSVPFVPLYFLYLYLVNKDHRDVKSIIFKNLVIFGLVNLIFYGPFLLWGSSDLIKDIIFYHLAGGSDSHFIAGFVGIPELLAYFGLISVYSRFPFWIIQLVLSILLLPIAKAIFLRNLNVSTLALVFVLYFSAILMFSRIIQTSYIAFLSQILILAGFLERSKKV